MDDHAPNPTAGRVSRRGVLAAGVTVSAALAAAGCATYSADSVAGSGPATESAGSGGATPGGATPDGAAPDRDAPDGAGAPPAGGGTALGPASEVPVGGGKIFKAQKVVVTQPAAGTFKAFSATCTHSGCTVAEVSGGTISCPCHGSTFSAADGSVTNGPATRPLPAKQVSSDGGTLRVT